MNTAPEAGLLRVILNETAKLHHRPLFEVIVQEARGAGITGAVAWRGIMGYDHSAPIQTAKILDLAADLPVIIEMADDEDKLIAFSPVLDRLFAESGGSGTVTLETVQIRRYPCAG